MRIDGASARVLALLGVLLVVVVVGVWLVVGALRSDGTAAPEVVSTLQPTAAAEPPAKLVPELPSGPLPPREAGEAVLVTDGPAVGKVALTFDDGLCAECVRAVVEFLEQTDTPATMFPNGKYADAWEGSIDLILPLVASGQIEFGNHTFDHADPRSLKRRDLARDLRRNEKWIWNTFRSDPRPLFRPPFGAYDDKVLRVAGNQGYTQVVTWSSSGLDWKLTEPDAIAGTVRDTLKPGAIILLHPNSMATIEAMPAILEELRARDLEPVLLSELLGER